MPKILIVEDNEFSCDMLSRRLKRKGYSIVTASNGTDGLSMVATEEPDIILMDLNMPVMDGWTAARLLKTSPEYKDIPIMAVSAHAMKGDCERALASGFDAYASKPIDFTNLLYKLEFLLSKLALVKVQ